VDGTHTYYVGEIGVLVHNAGNDCIGSVANIGVFFNKRKFGVRVKTISQQSSLLSGHPLQDK